MAIGVYISKVLAIATVVMTVSSIGGIITMMIVYETERIKINPTPPPTPNATILYPTGPPPNLRLPGNLIPESYDIVLQPHLYTVIPNATNQSLIFTGNSTVYFRCVEKTKAIFLHSKQNVTDVTVKDLDNKRTINVKNTILYNNESNFLEIRLEGVLEEDGNYSLFTAFEGELLNDLAGFYMSSYKKEPRTKDDTKTGLGNETTLDLDERFIATSQMQPTDARKVFPCFDEPAMKAEFKVTIIHRLSTHALANGKVTGTTLEDIDGETWEVTRFQTTKKMSTYLLAFTVSDFDSIVSTHERVDIKTYARPEAIKAGHAKYAADITGNILAFYESKEVFGMIYPLSKLDQIALPDFSAGAMENWGLITYRETALLYEEGVSSTSNKEWIATVIAHELAHQWFGNLVTMKWWNDLWLNEGFATYISYMGVDHIEPKWNIKDLFVLNDIQTAFQVDSLASSHPLSSNEDDVQTPSDITELFDSITYSKGAAVLRMLSDYLKDKVFMDGLKKYLQAFQYSNAVHKDLWECLQEAVDNDSGHIKVAEVMETWTMQMGYPVITINTTTGDVSQEHFLLIQPSDYNFTWHVPIKVMKEGLAPTALDTQVLAVPKERKSAFKSEDGKWVLANINCMGYFRVNYDPANWDRLLSQLETNIHEIPLINRGQLIDDAFNLARAKHINVTLALRTTKYLRNDTEYIPWESALRNLDYFILMFDRSEVYGPMQAYMRKQVGGLYQHFENVTTVPEDHSEQYNQINAISVACSNDIEDCQKMTKKLFDNWMTNKTSNPIQPNLKATIYCQAIAAGGEKEWEFAWGMFQNATTASEKDKLRFALSCTRKIWLLNRYLEYTLNPDLIRKMDAVSTINYIARNVAGQAIAWNFVRANWKYISLEYGGGIMSFGRLIEGVTQRFSTDFELQELRQFQSNYNEEELGSASRALEQAIERTQANIKWVKENKQTVLEWFRKESSESS
ncbi:alanyl (membrane) aminopeptidase-like b [Salmo salar]|uniref:Aminopeptidase n=1 Tax=Salmo salar TaxID=8030 RepID=A0A1S3KLX7_SALSA|nr:alanyl (membrane) aminopeptidase a [Salmo salar]|eukprot:XP_013979610.1 PREDICTED: aminopeptidase N-like [Salmo salar]